MIRFVLTLTVEDDAFDDAETIDDPHEGIATLLLMAAEQLDNREDVGILRNPKGDRVGGYVYERIRPDAN